MAVGQPLAVAPDWDVLSGFAADFARFIPTVTTAEVREVFRGYPAFSPDGRFIVGPVPGIRGFVMAAACNAHGVSGLRRPGRERAGQPGTRSVAADVRLLSPARFMPRDWTWEAARDRAELIYETYYGLTQPAEASAR